MRPVCRIPVARCRAYVAAGMTLQEIAEAEGWARCTVARHVRGLGMTTQRRIVEREDILAIAYGAMTIDDVMQDRGVSRAAVHAAAHRIGVRVGRGHQAVL